MIHKPTLSYRPDIDGLRAVAVLSVIIFHAFPAYLRGGFVGVDIFFFISGFLISSIIFNLLEQKKFGFVHFYSSRIKRIFPALLLVMLTCYFFAWLSLLPAEYKMLGKHIAGGLSFIDNFLLCRESGYFDTRSELKPLLHLWSLSIEEQFYLIFPVFVWLSWRMFSKRVCLSFIVIIAAISFIFNIQTISSNAAGAFFFPQSRIWELLFGSFFAYVTLFYREKVSQYVKHDVLFQKFNIHFKDSHKKRYLDLMSAVGFSFLIASVLIIHRDYFFPGFWPLLPLMGAALMVFAGQEAWCNRYILAHPVMVWIGLISYPLYLWHWPILSFIRITHTNAPSTLLLVGALALSVTLAWITYNVLERPIRFGAHDKRKVVLLCVLALILAYLGYTMFYEKTHPRSASLQPLGDNIISAINEWEYPKGLTPFTVAYNKTAYRIGGKEKVTLFFGDSNVEQYSPRIVELFKTKQLENRGAIFLTGGGCPPYRWMKDSRHPYCDKLVDSAIDLAQDEHIDTVVVGAAWFRYFTPNLFDSSLAHNKDISLMRNNLNQLFQSIAKPRRKIYLVLSIPRGHQVDPSAFIQRDLFHVGPSTQKVPPLYMAQYRAENKSAYALLHSVAIQNGLTVIDPLDYLCKDNQCLALDTDGRAKYKDQGHLRPTYVRNKVLYIDRAVI